MPVEFKDEDIKYIKTKTDEIINSSLGKLYGERSTFSKLYNNLCVTKENKEVRSVSCDDLKEGLDYISGARDILYSVREYIYSAIGLPAKEAVEKK